MISRLSSLLLVTISVFYYTILDYLLACLKLIKMLFYYPFFGSLVIFIGICLFNNDFFLGIYGVRSYNS